MKDFSQDFYNWLLSEKERIQMEIDNNIYNNIARNSLILLFRKIDYVIKKYKEICFGEDDE